MSGIVAENEPLPRLPRGRLLIILGVLLGLGGLIGWQFWIRHQAHQLFQQALQAARRDQLSQARELLQQSLARRPGQAEVVWYLARVLRRDGELDEARKQLTAAEALGFDPFKIGLERILISAQDGNFDAEEPSLSSFLEEDHPESPAVLEVLAIGYLLKYQGRPGFLAAKRWTELVPESPRAWKYYAKHSAILQLKARAGEAYRKSLELNPADRGLRLNVLQFMFDEKSPASDIQAVLQPLEPETSNDPEVLVMAGRLAELEGHLNKARDSYDRALAANPQFASAWHERGRLELELGVPAEGLKFLQQALEISPHDPDYLYSYHRALAVTGQAEEAQKMLAKWTQAVEDLKKMRELTRMIAQEPSKADLRYEAGMLFLRNGQTQEGLRWLRSAIQIQPNHKPSHQLLAEHFRKTNQPALAEPHEAIVKQLP